MEYVVTVRCDDGRQLHLQSFKVTSDSERLVEVSAGRVIISGNNLEGKHIRILPGPNHLVTIEER